MSDLRTSCPYHPYCGCPADMVSIDCPAINPRAGAPLDHAPAGITEPPLFRRIEVAGLCAIALIGIAALWFGAR
ncbi:hypothetical protein [Mesorhizobium sp. Root157]|uniref:hypothetical protein n=1 Tax=Mesorhizobium sp. Root157 TaxID=1736477 RepID=UPI000A8AADEF|nr:hypothetical protein [Mesorhizobium sp. Root157]